MTHFKHILVPTDFGEPAAHALDVAVTMASTFGATLTIFHAGWAPPLPHAPYADDAYDFAEQAARKAEKELAALVARTQARYPSTDGAFVRSQPWPAILEAAKDRGCDLIVMGTSGRHGLSRVLLGSVAAQVVRFSSIPVLTVSGRDRLPSRQGASANAGGG